MGHEDSDLKKIEDLIKIMKENDLVEVEIKHEDDKIFLKRAQPQQVVAGTVAPVQFVGPSGSAVSENNAQAQIAGAQQEQDNFVQIKSPMIGTFYEAASPDSGPYVEVGSEVNPQTIVCIVEAMKVMNEIKAETSGTIAEILVTNGQAVEYGQPFFRVKPE